MFGLDYGSGFEVVPGYIDTRSKIILKRVDKGDFRFSTVTEDCGITPDCFAPQELILMKRLNQIYDKTKEQAKAEEETTKIMYSTIKFFRKTIRTHWKQRLSFPLLPIHEHQPI